MGSCHSSDLYNQASLPLYSNLLYLLLLIAMFDLVIRQRIESATEFSANIYCNLIDLSAERFHMIIIEELLRDDLEGPDDEDEDE